MKDKALRSAILKKKKKFIGVTIWISRIKLVNAFKEHNVLEFEPITKASFVTVKQSQRKKNVQSLFVKEHEKRNDKLTTFDLAQNNRIKLATNLKDAIQNYKDFLEKNKAVITEKDLAKIMRYLVYTESKGEN